MMLLIDVLMYSLNKPKRDSVGQLHFNDAINLRNWIYRPRCLISEKKNEYNLLFI